MKTCISLYSYWNLVKEHKMNHYEVMDEISRLGCDAVEFQIFDASVPEGKTMADYIRDLHAYAVKLGLDVPMLTMQANLYGPKAEEDFNRLCGLLDVASECGIRFLRFDVTYSFLGTEPCRSYKAIIQSVAPHIRRLADYAEEKGVTVCSENHGRIMQDSYRMEELFFAVNHRNYKLLCDIGNFGGADENSAVAVSKLLPHICFVHAKDSILRDGMMYDPGRGFGRSRGGEYRRSTIFGHGNVPTYQILRAIGTSGYDGYVSLEFEGIEEPKMAVEISMENLKRMLADIGK